MDKAQSFVHTIKHAVESARSVVVPEPGTDCHVHWSPGMHKDRDDLPANLAEHEVGVVATVEKIYATCSRVGKRRAHEEMCVVSAICIKFQHQPCVPPSWTFMPKSTEFAVSEMT